MNKQKRLTPIERIRLIDEKTEIDLILNKDQTDQVLSYEIKKDLIKRREEIIQLVLSDIDLWRY